jgi:hypothetical protein
MAVMVQFGSWTVGDELVKHAKTFQSGAPFEHVVIPNFFADADADDIYNAFPAVDNNWNHYDNPIEQKYTLNKFYSNEVVNKVFEALQSPTMLELMKQITGIEDLETDPHLHGAGLHAYPSNGKLDMHLDYSLHPITGKERRVNLIIYMNKNWKEEYGGHLQLWDSNLDHCTELITPNFNTAAIFRTSDISYHGIPYPIKCPENQYRKSLAIYYVSPPRDQATHRHKAEFFPLPVQKQNMDPRLARLYDIRKYRLITQDDLADWPTWREDGNGHW